ncbi:MAG: metal-dependent transcriptional regulator [Eggerthellaceae bacterium]
MSISHEDYLEAIVMLGGTTGVSVRSVDIATKLDVSKASVNKAISSLKEKVLPTSPITATSLTEEGYAYGIRSSTAITCCSFTTKALGIPERAEGSLPHGHASATNRSKMEFLY